MNSSVCTLFEGNYHYGVAALVNSLYTQGYRGQIYAGYRGELPFWSTGGITNSNLSWPNCYTLQVADGLELHFLPLDTHYHFTNYKPDFMLQLWSTLASEAEALYYFDPDITVTAPWSVFEEWVACGVALCEDVTSPKPMHHPIREAWRRYFSTKGFSLTFKEAFYANGGFIGVSKKNRNFLATWQALQEAMAPAIGGLGNSFFVTMQSALPFAPFSIPDQDAMNAAVEAWDGPVSFVDKGGMAFISAASLMSHAIGKWKPWVRNSFARAIAGEPPRRADRDYWRSANGPIISQSTQIIKRRLLGVQFAALIGRFYKRS